MKPTQEVVSSAGRVQGLGGGVGFCVLPAAVGGARAGAYPVKAVTSLKGAKCGEFLLTSGANSIYTGVEFDALELQGAGNGQGYHVWLYENAHDAVFANAGTAARGSGQDVLYTYRFTQAQCAPGASTWYVFGKDGAGTDTVEVVPQSSDRLGGKMSSLALLDVSGYRSVTLYAHGYKVQGGGSPGDYHFCASHFASDALQVGADALLGSGVFFSSRRWRFGAPLSVVPGLNQGDACVPFLAPLMQFSFQLLYSNGAGIVFQDDSGYVAVSIVGER